MKAGAKRAALQLDRYRQRNPHVVRLACLASLAVRVEPFLLRTLRQDLLPDVDVGVEADLWFSSLVESRGADAVVLDANVVAVLRQELASDRALLGRALDITQRLHRYAPPSLQLEELVNAVALLDEGDPEATINEALRPALRTILEGGERAREVAQWAMRALPRSHPTVCRSESALSLLLVASSVLGGRRLVKEVPEIKIPLHRIGWALPEQALSQHVSLGVELLERGVRFSKPGSDRPGIELPRTDPIIVELEWSLGGERVGLLVEAKEGRTIDLEDEISELTLRTLAGDEYEIARVAMAVEAAPSIEAASGFIRRGVASLEDPVIAMKWSADGESLAFALQGGMLYVIESRRLLATRGSGLVELASKVSVEIEDGGLPTSVAWSPDGRYLGVGVDSGSVAIVDAHSFRTLSFLKLPAANPSQIAWSSDGALLATAVDGIIRIWDIRSGVLRAKLYTEEANVGGLAFSPDGRQFAATGVHRVTVWDTERSHILKRYAPSVWDELTCLAWNPPGDRLAIATASGAMAVLQLSDRDLPRIDQTDLGRIQNLAFTSDGRFLLGIDEWGSMALWNPSEGRKLAALSTTDGHRAVSALHAGGPSAAIWRTDGLVTVWDVGPDVFGPQKAAKGTCFVTMGFGKKTDSETGRTLDLDKSYQVLIKPAVEAADLECLRADEIPRSGAIDVPMFGRLLNADVVIADISTFSSYALYELGVRHALRPYTTIVIAEEGVMKTLPFDTNLTKIQTYRHRGEDIDVEEASRFRTELTETIRRALGKPEVDSPVYLLLPRLIPASMPVQATSGQADVNETYSSRDQGPSIKEGTCFVSMGFGRKTDFESGRVLDLDRSYLDLVKPAVEAAGLKCVPFDETAHSGSWDVQMYEQLLSADTVVVDISTSNRNASYQLGLRHALRPYTTVVIGEEGMMKAAPFDTNPIRIRTYRHRGEDVDIEEASRFRNELTESIQKALDKPEVDSPVYTFLPDLLPPRLKRRSVFISYRRDDSAAATDRLHDILSAHFGPDQIVIDADTMDPGVDFEEAIQKSVSSCDVLIAVIGKHWLTSLDDEGQRRIDNTEDFVRVEIATALKRDIRVIPVLLDGASMPRSGELPDDLKPLADRNAVEIRRAHFEDDCGRLVAAIERVPDGARVAQRIPSGASAPATAPKGPRADPTRAERFGNIFSLEVRRARQGDCLLLHFGPSDDPGLIMIDGGPKMVYKPHLKPRLEEIKTARGPSDEDSLPVDLLMVSHVDDDHIQGILDLTKELLEAKRERRPQLVQVLSFWHNSFDDIIGHKPEELTAAFRSQFGPAAVSGELPADATIDLGDEAGELTEEVIVDNLKVLASIEQGYQLRVDAEGLDFPRNPEFDGKLIIATKDAESIDMGRGLKFIVAGPMKPEVEALRKKHDEWLRELKAKGKSPPEALAAYVDKSVPNLSSLVLVAEAEGKRILLTGDARGDKIIAGLQLVGLLDPGVDSTMHVDVLKVPHHGSSNNLERGFFERIIADHYVFSGNGEHGNPEREALEMLFDARGSAEFTVHLTYPITDIDEGRRKDWEKERSKEANKKKRKPTTTVRPNWSPKSQSLEALLTERRAPDKKISIVDLRTPHLINLLDTVHF